MAIAAGGVSMAAVVIFVSSDEIYFLSDGNFFSSAGMHASSFSTCKGKECFWRDCRNSSLLVATRRKSSKLS